MPRTVLFTVATLWITLSASGAEIVLRERATPSGSIVRLGDVAEITDADGVTVERLAATPLMPAATDGAPQFVRMTELRDILTARGLDVRSLKLSGADVVTIGPATADTEAFNGGSSLRKNDVATIDAIVEQMTAAIAEHLRLQSGHDLWNIQVDADDDVVAAFQRAGSHAVVRGGKAPWSGRQRFTISGGPGTTSAMAYARIERLELTVVATRSIERGEYIRRTDVELRPHAGALPKLAIISMESIVGKEAVQGIRADSLLLANQVRSPLIVRRGERVSVRARAAGVTVRTYAVAQQDGSLGELVNVQSLEGKERYAARVSGLRELEIFAAGASAGDIASTTSTEVR